MGCLKPHCPFKHSKPRLALPGTFDRLTQYKEKGGMVHGWKKEGWREGWKGGRMEGWKDGKVEGGRELEG